MATQQIKDILGTDIPKPAWAYNPSRATPLPTEATFSRGGNGNETGVTLDPITGEFTGRGQDVPRIYGANQGLLVETFETKQRVSDSTNPSAPSWTLNGLSANATGTIFADGGGRRLVPDTTGGSLVQDFVFQSNGNPESASFILEQANANQSRVRVLDITDGVDVAIIEIDWADLTLTEITTSSSFSYKLVEKVRDEGVGAANGKIARIIVGYNGLPSGHWSAVRVQPDPNGNGAATIFHGAQLEENEQAGTVLYRGSSGRTRQADSLSFDLTEYTSPNRGTFFFEVVPRVKGNVSYMWTSKGSTKPGLFFGGKFGLWDPSGNRIDFGSPTRFQRHKVAFSFTDDQMWAAADGNSTAREPHDGSFLNTQEWSVGGFNGTAILLSRASYRTEALTRSELETLTA